MNIQEHIVSSENWTAGREGTEVTGIVLHTMDGSMAGSQARFDDPTSKVSVHYGVGMDGSITRWVDEANTAYQAGNWQVNLTTIGIEHEDLGNYNDAARTPQLYTSSAELVADICRRYNIPCDTDHILLHKNVIDTTVYPGGTSCPDALDTNKIIRMAQDNLKGGNMTLSKEEVIVIHQLIFNGKNPGPGVVDAWTGRNLDDFLHALQQDATYQAYEANISKLQAAAAASSDSTMQKMAADIQAVLAKYSK